MRRIGGSVPAYMLLEHLDEIELKPIDKRKLVKYVDKYPGTVRKALTDSLAFEHFAA